MKRALFFVLCFLSSPLLADEITAPVHHNIEVTLSPDKHTLTVSDRLSLPKTVDELTLHLHAGLNPRFSSSHGKLKVMKETSRGYWESYHITFPQETSQLQVEYAGSIHHALTSSRAEQARGFRRSAGMIDDQGVFLSGNTLWHPQLEGYPYLTYSMQVTLPPDWSSVSQGDHEQQPKDDKLFRERWRVNTPQEEIYLIAAPFTKYQREMTSQQGPIKAQVFLRQPDQALADKYLDATIHYLNLYEHLLGPYAYSKFALVENFWQTGFGMPSFTLLGSRVIRLPFILNSSYPHEILHNWWGNGVYVDFPTGNWSEGLTAYLADHLVKEQQGKGLTYRLQSLQKYRDYASKRRDFPLSQFTSRHSSSTEAVGYGKTMMLFHMLRRQLGDEAFIKALRQFYQDYRFRIASFNDIKQVFEQAANTSLDTFFQQWVERTGAPELALKTSRIEETSGQFRLHLTLQQIQPAEAYTLHIPVAVTLKNHSIANEYVLEMTAREQTFELDLPTQPTHITIDPQFDLFRKLAITETPPAFTEVFGAKNLLVILPTKSTGTMGSAWDRFAQDVSHMGPEEVTIVTDDELDSLPEDKAVMVLGWDNRFTSQLQKALAQHPIHFEEELVRFENTDTKKQDHAFAWVTRIDGSNNITYPRALITADMAKALAGLGRKIPHYHKYSYLVFSGDEPKNRLKGRWPVTTSPLSKRFNVDAKQARMKASPALIDP